MRPGVIASRCVPYAHPVCRGRQLQGGLAGMLYAKSLRVNHNVSKGQVMTLVSTDVSRLRELAEYVHYVVSTRVRTVCVGTIAPSRDSYCLLSTLSPLLVPSSSPPRPPPFHYWLP